jgi:hypothetical protein
MGRTEGLMRAISSFWPGGAVLFADGFCGLVFVLFSGNFGFGLGLRVLFLAFP